MITAKILRNKREKLKLTLRDVEKLTGVSNAYISQIESGVRPINLTPSIVKLLKFYGFEIICSDKKSKSIFKL